MIKNILNFFYKKNKKHNNYFLKDNLKNEIKENFCNVGRWSYGNPKIYRWDFKSKLIIGNFCSLGPEIKIYLGGNHRTDWLTTFPFPANQFLKNFDKAKKIKNFHHSRGNIRIGNDVWIGGHSIILSGSLIGDGCVIGAGSLVTGKLDPYCIYAGNPIKKIRNRFRKAIIKKIIQTNWWNLDDQIINDISKYLCSNNYKAFFKIIKKINQDHGLNGKK